MKTSGKLLRYGIVGLVSNGILYCIYLAFTGWFAWMAELATVIVYIIGILMTYVMNRNWSFKNTDSPTKTLLPYILAYLLGLGVQLGTLWFFYRILNIPHQLAQLIAMGAAAGCIFLSLNYIVFRDSNAET